MNVRKNTFGRLLLFFFETLKCMLCAFNNMSYKDLVVSTGDHRQKYLCYSFFFLGLILGPT